MSQFKEFVKCPAMAMAKLRGEWQDKPSRALLLGSFVDEMLTGTPISQAKFIANNVGELFQKNSPIHKIPRKELKRIIANNVGELFHPVNKSFADIVQANEAIRRVKEQPLMMHFLNANNQTILTGKIEGVPIKGKLDSYAPYEFIADLKYLKDFRSPNMFENAVSFYGYDMQSAVYRELVKQNTGVSLPCYLVIVTKQDPPDVAVAQVNEFDLDEALEKFKKQIKHFQSIKKGEIPPERCESTDCPYCRATRVLKEPTDCSLLGMSRKQLDAMNGVLN